jgi:hypothetical protein
MYCMTGVLLLAGGQVFSSQLCLHVSEAHVAFYPTDDHLASYRDDVNMLNTFTLPHEKTKLICYIMIIS